MRGCCCCFFNLFATRTDQNKKHSHPIRFPDKSTDSSTPSIIEMIHVFYDITVFSATV